MQYKGNPIMRNRKTNGRTDGHFEVVDSTEVEKSVHYFMEKTGMSHLGYV